MRADVISAWVSVASLVLVAGSVLAAIVQLRHLRSSNQLEALLSVEETFRSNEMQSALKYMQLDMPDRLKDPKYRRDLFEIGFVDTDDHPELLLCNWFNEMGVILKHDFVREDAFMDMFARLIVFCWRQLGPIVALMRRNRGDVQYHDFEYLAVRAQDWLKRNPQGVFPRNVPRDSPADPWREADLATRSADA